MRVAYLILAHEDPQFVVRLAKRLVQSTDIHCFIHVDAKSTDFDGYMIDTINIHWIRKRRAVYWGGYSVVSATLTLLNEAFNYKFDRYMILHGADYPLYSNQYISDFFEENRSVEFINAVDETDGDRRHWYRYVSKNYLDNPNLLKRIKNRLNAEYWRSSLPKGSRKCTVRYDGKDHHIYRGWGHFAITHRCAEYILDFSNRHYDYNEFFKHVYVPDESYFHTIVYNSDFMRNTVYGKPISPDKRSSRAMLNLTYFEYPSSVRVFTNSYEYDYLKNTGYIFFRKATSKSKELLDKIDDGE